MSYYTVLSASVVNEPHNILYFLFYVLAILYELLYERVFGMEQPVRIALEMISSKAFVVHGSGFSADGNTDKTR